MNSLEKIGTYIMDYVHTFVALVHNWVAFFESLLG